jgi:hypothetical protein
MVQRWTGSEFDAAQPVPPGRETRLGTRDQVILGESVLLRLSGKRYLAEPTFPDPAAAGPDGEASATTVTRVQTAGQATGRAG